MKGDYIDKCRKCLFFDPAYDQCCFYGMVGTDDLACTEFQPLAEFSQRI